MSQWKNSFYADEHHLHAARHGVRAVALPARPTHSDVCIPWSRSPGEIGFLTRPCCMWQSLLTLCLNAETSSPTLAEWKTDDYQSMLFLCGQLHGIPQYQALLNDRGQVLTWDGLVSPPPPTEIVDKVGCRSIGRASRPGKGRFSSNPTHE